MKKLDFIGTRSLVSLALRRDRIRLTAWILGISLMVLMIVMAYAEFSAREMQEMITMASVNQGMRMLVSPIAAEQVGELGPFFLFRTSFLLSILVAMFNIQLVIRHTRHNEESGCTEMISSAVAGRYSALAASLIVALLANSLLFILLLAAFAAAGLSLAGSAAAALSFAGLGLVFAAAAAVTAQLSESSRGASALASIALAGTFLLNSVGNVMGTVHEQAMGFSSGWLVWLSPIGWTQQMQAFDQNRIAVMLLPIALCLLLTLLAGGLIHRRDIGRGIIPASRGRARATIWLTGSAGLVWRLQRKSLLGWLIAVLLVGMIFGAVSQEYGSAIEDIDVFQQFLLSAEYFIFSMIAIVSAVLSWFALQSLMRMRSEESHGTLEAVLATPMRRFGWMISYILFSLAGTLLLLITFAAGAALSAQSSTSDIQEFIQAALYHGTAIFALAGLMAALFGLLPGIARGLSFILVMVAILAGPVFGPLLNLPEGLRNISPFTHVDLLPAQTSSTALLILLLIGFGLNLVGLVSFSRRNLRLS